MDLEGDDILRYAFIHSTVILQNSYYESRSLLGTEAAEISSPVHKTISLVQKMSSPVQTITFLGQKYSHYLFIPKIQIRECLSQSPFGGSTHPWP